MEALKKLVSDRLRVAGGQGASAAPHPDADTLSAFAEHALSDSERTRVLEHLGGCRDCRDTLYLASPSSEDLQRVLTVSSRRSPGFALRWGTLAAALAITVIVLVGTRRHAEVSLYKSTEAPKAAPPVSTAADLKTPPEIAEMRALRDDRANTNVVVKKEADKVIPTPKHMTARPAASFDIDQTGQVRMSRPDEALRDKIPSQGASFSASSKLDAGAPATPSSRAVGGLVQNQNSVNEYRITSGQPLGSAATPGAVNGTIVDPSGAVVANATVTVTGPVGTRAVQSDTQGQFAFDRLAPGSYSVRAQAQGFQTAELQQVAILANKPANLQVTLQVGRSSETIAVTGAAQVETTNSAEQTQLAKTQLQTQPAAVPALSGREQNSRQKKAKSGNEVESNKATALGGGMAGMAFAKMLPQFTLAPDGAVQRSLDSGQTWQAIPVASSARFRALSSVGAEVWVGGQSGALYHSSDSGQTWTRITPTANSQKLESDIVRVDFSDALNGAVITANSHSWTTSDGGQSWSVK